MVSRLIGFKKCVEEGGMHAPISELLNMPLTEIENGRAVFELDVKEEHLNSNGVIQGGVLSALTAAACGLAFGSMCDEEEKYAGIESKINYFRPTFVGDHLRAVGEVTNATRTTGYVECVVTNKVGKKVAKCITTCIKN